MVLQPTRDDLRIAWLTALAVSIHLLESALPSPLPGVKPGLANVITVAVLIYFGWAMAAWISLLRVTAGSVLLGTFLSPTFVLSLSGAVASIFVLGLVTLSTGRTLLGPVGYSIMTLVCQCRHRAVCCGPRTMGANGARHGYNLRATD